MAVCSACGVVGLERELEGRPGEAKRFELGFGGDGSAAAFLGVKLLDFAEECRERGR